MSLAKTLWSGKNKATVRQAKIDYLVSSGIKSPLCLSFPGTQLRLEKLLVERGLVKPSRIVGIQTPSVIGKTSGRDVLKSLFKELNQLHWDMPIFVGDFSRFPNAHRTGKYHPVVTPKNKKNDYKNWRATRFGANLKFSFVDLDLCCPFNPAMARALERLYDNNLLAEEGLLVINHMKGREQVGAVKRYLIENSILPPQQIQATGNRYRFKDLPLFYTRQAARNGLALKLDNIIEYRDQNENSPFAVNMIQYFFSFTKTSSVRLKNLTYAANFDTATQITAEVSKAKTIKTVSSDFYQKLID